MRKSALHIISIFFILVFLAKGLCTILPAAQIFNSNELMELLVENENEENKNSSRFNETNVAEELFDHHLIFSSFSATGAVSVKLLTDGHSSLPGIYLEINTPPPDRC